MKHTPALIVATWLRLQGLGTDLLIDGPNYWPVFVNQIGDSPNRAISVYTTAGNIDGRLQKDGTTIYHPGIQFSVRAKVSEEAEVKLSEIFETSDKLNNEIITVESTRYKVSGIHKQSTFAFSGPDSKTRFTFTLNAITTIQELQS